ncbi:MAG: energy transducer TonB [Lutibacter sp.]|uniref:energy transducer TonB n=1 Tax=Lutibacter sp. TaxID=1925666 RepID=UPI00299D9A96|nr:energy transducer TonB [Lutibacter sp.]MDX1828540.1 energy transducer TonB [Lutibacter sp.]
MKTKKHPKSNLENYRRLFVQLGLVLALFISYSLIQKTSTFKIKKSNAFGSTLKDDSEQLKEYNIEKLKLKNIPKKKINIPIILKIDDNKPEDNFLFEDMDPDGAVDISQIKDIKIDEPDNDKEELLINVEEAPIFPGCSGTNEEKKACFINQIRKFVNQNFNSNLAEELSLSRGTKRIFTIFKIDKNGNVVGIRARATHKKLQEEAVRVINLIPKMAPGRKKGKPVVIKYSLPIAFKVE